MNLQFSTGHIRFHVEPLTGSLVVHDVSLDRSVEIPHTIAVELIEILRSKLYDHKNESETFLTRLFK